LVGNGIELGLYRADVLSGSNWTSSRGIAAGENLQQAVDGFIDEWCLFGAVLAKVRVDGSLKRRAKTDLTIVGRAGAHALINGRIEDIRVPTVEEIAVKAIACCVALGEDEHPTVGLINAVDRVDDFEEQMREQDRMGRRTDAVVNAREVSDVGLVSLVQVDAVPAALEVDLGSKPGVALGGLEPRGFRLRATAV
jgi:hypothetical protein